MATAEQSVPPADKELQPFRLVDDVEKVGPRVQLIAASFGLDSPPLDWKKCIHTPGPPQIVMAALFGRVSNTDLPRERDELSLLCGERKLNRVQRRSIPSTANESASKQEPCWR